MSEYTNGQDLSLSVAAWLALDEYKANPEIISATQIIKPIRQLILGYRIEQGLAVNVIMAPTEIMGMLKSRKGTAVHSAIENTWIDPEKRTKALTALGYTPDGIKRFKVNVEPEDLVKGDIPVYTERFCEREHDSGYWVGGTADMVMRGKLQDYKNTSTFSYGDPAKINKYQLQGSIYRWAMPDIVTEDEMIITEMYDDWTKAKAYGSNYPPFPVMDIPVGLLSIKATDKYIDRKIKDLVELMNEDEAELPFCTAEDLWRKPDVYKYYKNPTSTKRSTGNYDTYEDAAVAHRADGSVGVIKTVPGKAVACRFCNARPICSQAKTLKANGELDD